MNMTDNKIFQSFQNNGDLVKKRGKSSISAEWVPLTKMRLFRPSSSQ